MRSSARELKPRRRRSGKASPRCSPSPICRLSRQMNSRCCSVTRTRIGALRVSINGSTWRSMITYVRPAALSESLKADHGFHVESRAIRDLIEIMSEYDGPSRRSYLQFITGSPKLPIGGMCASSVLTHSSLTTTLRRLQGSQSSSHRCPQTSRSTTHGRRLSPECHDLRQLPQTAGVLVQVYDAGEAIGCNAGRRRKFPLVLKDPSSLSHIIVALPILPCIVITCLYHHV